MDKKVRIKKEAFIECGLCTSIANQVFAFGDDGLAENVLPTTLKLLTKYKNHQTLVLLILRS